MNGLSGKLRRNCKDKCAASISGDSDLLGKKGIYMNQIMQQDGARHEEKLRHNYRYDSAARSAEIAMRTKSDSKHKKVRALLEEGTLNSAPEKVRDAKFRGSEFFDPHDIVQVKYEMLRRVSIEKASVVSATEEYGVSRPTYYQTKASFEETGIVGLVPRKRGPRGPHKLQGAVLAFIQERLVAGEPLRARELARQIEEKFHLDVHPRTIERAVAVKKTAR